MAAIYATLSLAMYYALTTIMRPRHSWQLVLITAISIAFSFNGIVMQGVWMPHFEYAIPAGIFLFLLHYKLGNIKWALFFFALTLIMREDAGFHIVAVLGLLTCLEYRKTRSLKAIRGELYLLLAAFCYSAFAWFMTFHIRKLYGIDGSVFKEIIPAGLLIITLSLHLLSGRLYTMFIEKVYFWPAILVLSFFAWRTRNPYWIMELLLMYPGSFSTGLR